MKKNYENMKAYKVEFNASEQVAAAACNFMTESGQYAVTAGGGGCTYVESTVQDKYRIVGGTNRCEQNFGEPERTLQYI